MAEKRYNLNDASRQKLADLLSDRPQKERPQRHRQATPRQKFGGILFQNGAGASIPPHAVMQIDGADLARDRPYVTVRKPEAGGTLYLFNGPREVPYPHSGLAIGYREGRALVADGSPTTPLYSPQPGEWELSSGGAHFQLAGDLDSATGFFLLTGDGFGLIQGSLKGEMTGADETHTMDGISVLQGLDPRDDTGSSTEEITITNTFLWDADDNAAAFALWDKTNQLWKLFQVECPD